MIDLILTSTQWTDTVTGIGVSKICKTYTGRLSEIHGIPILFDDDKNYDHSIRNSGVILSFKNEDDKLIFQLACL